MEIAALDELTLVQRCKGGSESAYAELVRRHRPRLFTLAYRLTGDRDAAEDVVQDSFIAAFRSLDRFEPRPSLAAWLNTIVLRTAGRAAAKAATRPRASLDDLIDDEAVGRIAADATAAGSDDPHRAAEAAELRREVTGAITALPFKYRAAVVTRYVMGLDYAEAAASLEMGLNTYKSHLLRGTRLLRDALALATGRELRATGLPAVASEPQPVAIAPEPDGAHGLPVGLGSATAVPAAVQGLRSGGRPPSETRRTRFADAVPSEKGARG